MNKQYLFVYFKAGVSFSKCSPWSFGQQHFSKRIAETQYFGSMLFKMDRVISIIVEAIRAKSGNAA
jgi:hypothetical protein